MSKTAYERATEFSDRLKFRGLLEKCSVGALQRSGRAYLLHLRWTLPDTQGEGDWETLVVLRLPDSETEEQWARRLLFALADACGHELGEAVLIDGVPPFDPHHRPRLFPWRACDRSEA